LNRSHHEDVLVVHSQPRALEAGNAATTTSARAETVQAGEGATTVKLFLHGSKDEQPTVPRPGATISTRAGWPPSVTRPHAKSAATITKKRSG
jgi:hypothetical protein